MDDYTPAPQTVAVASAAAHMERPVEVVVTTHMNEHHSNATRVWLTRDEARDLVHALVDYLTEEDV